nr:MAG TPA: hypothetical protein [Caudoviricetes sp.]
MYRPCDLYGFQSKMLFEKKRFLTATNSQELDGSQFR